MPSKKCCETIFDITTKVKDCAILIQRIWTGFYTRKKLKNLFYNLPSELQSHVMKYVRADHYIEKQWIPSVLKIYINRLVKYHTLKTYLCFRYDNHELDTDEFQLHIDEIFKKEEQVYFMIDAFSDK